MILVPRRKLIVPRRTQRGFIINPFAFGGGGGTNYLDDLATTPQCVLSLSKLISTATNAIRVRRSSDSTESDIGFSGDTLDTTALATFCGASSGYITKIYDQTGNGFDAVQATAANQPRIYNAGSYDGKAVFDGSNDSLKITSLTMGTPQVGVYYKAKLPSDSGIQVLMEQSTNYNSNSQSMILYYDSATSKKLNAGSRNTTSASDYRSTTFGATAGTLEQITILFDRSVSGAGEIAAWKAGSSLAPTATGGTAEQTGNYSTYDLHIGARAGTSLFADIDLFTLVIYTANSSAIRTSIESLVA